MHRRGISFNSMEASGPPIEPLNLQHSSSHLSHRVSRPCPIHLPIPHPALHLKMGIFLSKKKSVGTARFARRFCTLWSVECGFQRRCAILIKKMIVLPRQIKVLCI